MTSETLIEVRDLERTYTCGSAEVRALDGVSIDVTRGELLAVVGVSGSGKSTLLQLLGGLETPSSGTIRVNGRDLAGLSSFERALYRRETVGFVFQAFHLVPSMTAEENVALALTFQGVVGAERSSRTREALEKVGLAARLRHRPTQLSGGEQQRVALARALVHEPPLLLADEPTGNLDQATAREVMDLIRDTNSRDGTTVIVVTHDTEVAERYASRRLTLRDGREVVP